MVYSNYSEARFLCRPNRFIAQVERNGREETVHVKNTGRCRELLLPGAGVILTESANPKRKTRYDLVSVWREGQLINIDSQAPNQVAGEYLKRLYPNALRIRPEFRRGDSRLDFFVELADEKHLFVEVKGVTLLDGDTALFPDAPTLRGVKHIHALMDCLQCGDAAMLLFIVQMRRARCLRPNDATHPAFGQALREAFARGVQILAVDCDVTEGSITARDPVPVEL